MSSWAEHWRTRIAPTAVPETLWLGFAAANTLWMLEMPDWASVPFHFIWVSLTLLYGFRSWSAAFTWSLLAGTVVVTGSVLGLEQLVGLRPADEILEVPLMTAMFLAMMWHAHRRTVALREVERLSQEHLDMLQREVAFVQNASHELRTPITVALANAELMHRSQPRNRDLDVVVDELGRIRRLVDRLLALATAEEDSPAGYVTVALSTLASEAVRRWSAVPRRWVLVAEDDGPVRADPERLRLALDAVLENAVKFTGEGDVIEVRVAVADGWGSLLVGDSGPGIPQEDLGAVFQRFRRATGPRGAAEGFGLGLSIVRAVAERHGGRVVAGRSRWGGASVELRLPLAAGDGAEAAPITAAAVPGQVPAPASEG